MSGANGRQLGSFIIHNNSIVLLNKTNCKLTVSNFWYFNKDHNDQDCLKGYAEQQITFLNGQKCPDMTQ